MSTVYNPFDPDYLDARQQNRDECARGLTETHNAVPLELAADRHRESLMDAIDAGKNRRAPDPLPPRLAQNQASNNARRRVVPIQTGPSRYEPLLGANRGAVTDSSHPLAPGTADTLIRLLKQAGRPDQVRAVVDQQLRGGRPW